MTVPKPKTVVVLGASYGGAHASRLLSLSLPSGWRVVVIDRNSHMNHVYVFPRFTIIPSHAPKGFIPLVNLLNQPQPSATTTTSKPRANSSSSKLRPKVLPTPPTSPHLQEPIEIAEKPEPDVHTFIQGTVTSLHKNHVTITRPSKRHPSTLPGSETPSTPGTPALIPHTIDFAGPEETIEFDYAIYALGSGMPDPVNVWSEHPNMPSGVGGDYHERGLGSKKGGIRWMEKKAEQLKEAKSIIIVGGGALGIQFATDLKEVYPDKKIVLLHSRLQFMPLYPIEVHVAVMETLQKLDIEIVLGERVITWCEEPEKLDGKPKILRTDKGRQFEADLILPCTGQKPHVSLLAALAPTCISPLTSRIRVKPTLQVLTTPSDSPNSLEHLENLSLSSTGTSSKPEISSLGQIDEEDSETQKKADSLDNIFAIGDCAETGAIQAGHTAYYQGELAVRNILSLIEQREGRSRKAALETYTPSPPAIKISLGLKKQVTANASGVKVSYDGVDDLNAGYMWPAYEAGDLDYDM